MRRNTFLLLAALILCAAAFPKTIQAFPQVAASSAAFTQTPQLVAVDRRADALRAYLAERNSPLTDEAGVLVAEADKNNLDWRLVAAISGVESGFGQAIPAGSYNGWGWGIYGNNTHAFTSWDAAITEISEGLRNTYMDKWGAKDVYQIGRFYAASPTWASRVLDYMDEIGDFYQYQENSRLSISL